ncbi:MAG: sulfotransferase [bacterium]|nr:sulfotransferase [bacterium]
MDSDAQGHPLVDDPIIVLGAPRSGTTYLQSILDRHPAIAMTNEVRLFEWLHRALELTHEAEAVLFERDEFRAHLERELPALVRRYFAGKKPGARWWGDKNPHYAASTATLATIARAFPGARFVHIVRDARAVLASLLNKRHADGTPWISHPEYAHTMIANHLDFAREHGEALAAEQFYELRYEDLVANDEQVARELFDWLGIPFVEEVAAFCRDQASERTSFSGPTSDLQAAGNREAAQTAWSQVAPPPQQRESLRFLAPYLLRYGYETETSVEALIDTLPPAG